MERMGISRLKADELIVSMFGTCGLSPSKEMQEATGKVKGPVFQDWNNHVHLFQPRHVLHACSLSHLPQGDSQIIPSSIQVHASLILVSGDLSLNVKLILWEQITKKGECNVG